MGGLVSRSFIERGDGKQVVHRLVMLGTPNGGSPWPNVVDWATAALALGLNNLTGTPWPALVLRGLAKLVGDPRVAMKEMVPSSPTLIELNTSPHPGIPYALIAGNTSIIAAAAEQDMIARLLNKLFGTSPLYAIANPFFDGAANDIAVAIDSMKEVADCRQMAVETVPCDHVTYFHNEQSLAALRRALWA
jgi:hypothetical protein